MFGSERQRSLGIIRMPLEYGEYVSTSVQIVKFLFFWLNIMYSSSVLRGCGLGMNLSTIRDSTDEHMDTATRTLSHLHR